MSRLVFLTTSPRVAPGLMASAAWDAMRRADRVLARDSAHPQALYLNAAGVTVEFLESDAGAALDDSQIAAVLLAAAREEVVVFLCGVDGDPALGRAVSEQLLPLVESGIAPEIELLPASWDLPGARLLDLVAVMDRLRSPGGCPWDAEQTHTSLVTYLIEETYEALEAIESDDIAALREELGDLLLQVVFHSRLAEERGEESWSIDDVAGGVVDKLVRRHPHVFESSSQLRTGEGDGADPHGGVLTAERLEHLETEWQRAKAVEKARDSVLDGIPLAQPALSLAIKMLSRVERGGVQVAPPSEPATDQATDRLGHDLLALVVRARREGIDPEAALRQALRDYAKRVRQAEHAAAT